MSIRIIKNGIYDTFQDLGKYGFQHLGINPNGAMDKFSLRLSNIILGNKENEATLECFFPASVIQFEKTTEICISGADFNPTLDGKEILLNAIVKVKAGDILRFSKINKGNVCYISIKNGFALEEWLGSKSTSTLVSKGGFKGRKLMTGDQINFNNNIEAEPQKSNKWFYPYNFNTGEIRVLKGADFDLLEKESIHQLESEKISIGLNSNRMAYTITSDFKRTSSHQKLSSAVQMGSIQLLPNGNSLVLMADHQTTGGYPLILQVIQADLPKLAQMRPMQETSFKLVSIEEARRLYLQQEKELSDIKEAVQLKEIYL